VLLGDVIKTELPHFDVCISNTPYQVFYSSGWERRGIDNAQISSPLVFKLLALKDPPRTSILMFQREFALRLTARPGDALYCRLSVNGKISSQEIGILSVEDESLRPMSRATRKTNEFCRP
jgi:18S rRNA (adenine1779-N6/adenine1780-N6)-dimethyltransferase